MRERDRGISRKREKPRRERNSDLLLPFCALSADCSHSRGMYLDWESNPWYFAVQDNTPTYIATQAGALYLCYVSFILLTLGSCWFPFCSSSRHYIRLVTRDFLFLDVSLPVMMKLLSYYHVLRNPQLWYDLTTRRKVMNTKNNKQNRNRIMYTRNSLTASRGKVVWKWWWGGEGIRQRTCLSDPWYGTTVWGWTVGWQVGLEEGRVKGKIGTSVVK